MNINETCTNKQGKQVTETKAPILKTKNKNCCQN